MGQLDQWRSVAGLEQLAELEQLAGLARLAERLEQLEQLEQLGEHLSHPDLEAGCPQPLPNSQTGVRARLLQASEEEFGPLDLLVVQPTPFCNIDCRYCYLPDRNSKKRISSDTLERLFARVFASELVRGGFTVVWHAGEPLVLRPDFYEAAFTIAARHNRAHIAIAHSFQTNGMLIDQAWCDLIKRYQVHIGVSVDGPAFLHDAQRRTRAGRGTHAQVMTGIQLLQDNGIPFHVISVLTRDVLDYPDELFAFYVDHGIRHVGFNVEEIEGPHSQSSLGQPDVEARFRRFLGRFFDLVNQNDHPFRVREFDSVIAAVLHGGRDKPLRTQETQPFAIVSVDCDGNFCCFSPELLGLKSGRYGDFVFGNVCTDSLETGRTSPAFRALHADIVAGVEQCRRTCSYFEFCGGGAPVNKYCENGAFDSTETLFCRLNRKALVDVILDKLQPVPLAPAASTGEGH